MNYIVFRGVINESVNTDKTIIGDDINQMIISADYNPRMGSVIRFTCDYINNAYGKTQNCIIKNTKLQQISIGYDYVFTNQIFSSNGNIGYNDWNHSTIKKYIAAFYVFEYRQHQNILISDEFDIQIDTKFYNKFYVFISSCVFKYNSIDIIQPIWTNNSKENIQLLRNSYLSAGMNQENVDFLFLKDSFNNETCRIILEERNGGTSGNVFNRYNTDGSVLDFSLNPQSNNEALYASDLGGYVGCFGPANAVLPTDLDIPSNVNSDGSDDVVNPATLLRGNVDNTFDFNTASLQIWNRMKSHTTIIIPNGVKFRGSESMEDDGTDFGYYFGKKQDLISNVIINVGDVLEPNILYKVTNTNKDVFSAVLYNGTQYLPDYFFKTSPEILNFTLLNEGSGTVLYKVLSIPFESEEIIPYDDVNTISTTFPKFSCPFFGNVHMLYHKIGDRIDLPVLFSEVPNDKISYYSDYAVTNADQEFII